MWFDISGVLLAATGYAAYRAFDTLRDWGLRWGWPWLAGALLLAGVTGLSLFEPWGHPGAMAWMPFDQAASFGPGWRCDNLVRGTVCFRDAPKADRSAAPQVNAAR